MRVCRDLRHRIYNGFTFAETVSERGELLCCIDPSGSIALQLDLSCLGNLMYLAIPYAIFRGTACKVRVVG